jgi:hypothetical protein
MSKQPKKIHSERVMMMMVMTRRKSLCIIVCMRYHCRLSFLDLELLVLSLSFDNNERMILLCLPSRSTQQQQEVPSLSKGAREVKMSLSARFFFSTAKGYLIFTAFAFQPLEGKPGRLFLIIHFSFSITFTTVRTRRRMIKGTTTKKFLSSLI